MVTVVCIRAFACVFDDTETQIRKATVLYAIDAIYVFAFYS